MALVSYFPIFARPSGRGTSYPRAFFLLVTTVGRNEALIKEYIEEQGKNDSGQTLFSV